MPPIPRIEQGGELSLQVTASSTTTQKPQHNVSPNFRPAKPSVLIATSYNCAMWSSEKRRRTARACDECKRTKKQVCRYPSMPRTLHRPNLESVKSSHLIPSILHFKTSVSTSNLYLTPAPTDNPNSAPETSLALSAQLAHARASSLVTLQRQRMGNIAKVMHLDLVSHKPGTRSLQMRRGLKRLMSARS